MEIRELYLKNFGKFSDCHFFMEDGIQIFYGENEYGKSTIYAFIKAMLFGLDRGRGRAAQNDEFSRYEPWENPNYYAGIMRFTSGGKQFRLERSFDRYTKSASLVCEDDGEELSVEDGDLEMLLGGMTKESFDNTIAVGQLSARPGQELAEELKNYAANYYETGSSTVDLSGALDKLRMRKKSVEQEIKILYEKQEEKREIIRRECQYVTKDAEKLQSELEDNQEKLKTSRDLLRDMELPGEMDEPDKDGRGEAYNEDAGQKKHPDTDSGKSYITLGLLGIIAGIAGRIWSFFTGSQSIFTGGGAISAMSWMILVAGILLVCFGGIKSIRHRFHKKYGGEELQKQIENQQGKDKQFQKSEKIEQEKEYLQKLKWENQRIKSEWKEKQVRFQNLQEQLAELDMPEPKIKNLQMTSQALQMAEEKLLSASRQMVQGFGDILNRKASGILGQITEGRYTRLLVDEQLNMTLLEDGRRIPVERVSAGTIEQVYFALRMAAAEILYEEPLPVIFDDAFAFYDEKRLKSTLKWLSEQQRQVIIFTCQKREQEIIKQF
ncbi:ATP-binding protein [Faecalicatena orotica]|uniref:ATP-binding protein n=1 Tax=Faecalicatena orotica TaxID=1544 RepID=UPI0032162EB4